MVILFWPWKLGAKPDTLTRWWDIYTKGEGNSDFTWQTQANSNLSHTEQLNQSLCATSLTTDYPCNASSWMLDQTPQWPFTPHLPLNPSMQHIANPHWTQLDTWWESGLLCQYDWITSLMIMIFALKVYIQAWSHLSGPFRFVCFWPTQNPGSSTTRNVWPPTTSELCANFCKSCTNCMCSKSPATNPMDFWSNFRTRKTVELHFHNFHLKQLTSIHGLHFSILVIVTKPLRKAFYIPTWTKSHPWTCQAIPNPVVLQHRVPHNVTCDQGSTSFSTFQSRNKALALRFTFTSGYTQKETVKQNVP